MGGCLKDAGEPSREERPSIWAKLEERIFKTRWKKEWPCGFIWIIFGFVATKTSREAVAVFYAN